MFENIANSEQKTEKEGKCRMKYICGGKEARLINNEKRKLKTEIISTKKIDRES